jgi:NAD(P)H-dependent FMN reductase
VTPEWNGMAPPALKSFFLALDSQEGWHKPCLIIGISATAGGSYPIAELRMSAYKNSRICFLPEHVIIRNVKQVLNDPTAAAGDYDSEIRQRLHFTLGQLIAYAGALGPVRQNAFVKDFPYKWGM